MDGRPGLMLSVKKPKAAFSCSFGLLDPAKALVGDSIREKSNSPVCSLRDPERAAHST